MKQLGEDRTIYMVSGHWLTVVGVVLKEEISRQSFLLAYLRSDEPVYRRSRQGHSSRYPGDLEKLVWSIWLRSE